MPNHDCVHCANLELTYDLAGAKNLNTLQAEVIESLIAERDALRVALVEMISRASEVYVLWDMHADIYPALNKLDDAAVAATSLLGIRPPAEEPGSCPHCANPLQVVRPGKAQCPVCE